jgi:hypothetical protein
MSKGACMHAPFNLPDAVLWGFVATIVLSTMLAASWGLGLSRMSVTFLLGTMFTPDRRRARLYGLLFHMANGWAFAFLYIAAFESLRLATWWLGVLIGVVHALFVLAVVMPLLPSMHPRMASVEQGPTAVRRLQPPASWPCTTVGEPPRSRSSPTPSTGPSSAPSTASRPS